MGKHFTNCMRLLTFALALLLLSCSQPPPDRRPALDDPSEQGRAPAVPPAPSRAAPIALKDETPADNNNRRPFAEIFRGTSGFVAAAQPVRRSAAVTPDGEASINFVNADVRDVAKAVLGDLLKLNYAVDPSVQGPITVQTNRPIEKSAVLPVLEAALRLSGFALVKSADDFYQIIPAANAPRQSGAANGVQAAARQPGFGVEIVPLRYIAAAEMQRLLDPLIPAGSIQGIDAARNLVIVAGTPEERATILDDIALFDVDWLSGMSFALFTPTSVDAKTLAKSLTQIIGGRDSPISGIVRLIPIEHQNAVLAISPQPKYLEELRPWVDRLDHAGETAERRIYVYHVEHGRATDLAGVLNKLLNRGGGTGSEARINAIRPGDTSEVTIDKSTPGAAGAVPGLGIGGPATAMGAGLGTPQPPANAGYPARAPTSLSSQGVAAEDDISGGPSDSGIATQSASGARITADEINNSLLIMATAREYAVIEAALQQLDVVPLQVLLEAAIAEVTLTNDLKYGVQYFIQTGHHQITRTDASIPIAPTLPGFAYTFAASSNIQLILSAIDAVTHVEVISSPAVLVLNNQTATLQVGDQVPIATQQAISVVTTGAPVVNTIEYRDTGVTLKVTPRVNKGGMVMMDISQEVSDVAATTTSTLNSPTINQRKISSTIAVQDGETIALGGLISDNRTKTNSGIPVLQDIPVLGALFRTTEDQHNRTELIVLITPHVVENMQASRSVTDELRRKLPLTRPLIQGWK